MPENLNDGEFVFSLDSVTLNLSGNTSFFLWLKKIFGHFVGIKLFKLSLPQPKLVKDKGYAWFIIFMSFLAHLSHAGFGFGVVGIMTTANKDHFEIPIAVSTSISSVFIGMLMALG